MTLRKERILSFEGGSCGSHYVESSLWKRLWTCRKTDYWMNEWIIYNLCFRYRSVWSWWRARFSTPVQTGPGARPASFAMGTASFPGVKSGRGVTLTPHPFLVPWSWKSRAIPLLLVWAVRPLQSLSACTRVTFTFTFTVWSWCYKKKWPLFDSSSSEQTRSVTECFVLFCFVLFAEV